MNFPLASNSSRSARRGYVLLVTLGLLVLSATLLVAVGRAAANHALAARLEISQMQQRWGTISCRSAILPNAERILASREQQEGRAVAEYRATVELGEDRFTLIVSDEQAKANINAIIDQVGVQAAEDRIRQETSGSGLINQVRLRPAVFAEATLPLPATRPATRPQLIFGPGQMFDSVLPDRLIDPRPGGTAPMQSLTCWGDGSLNVMRANEDAMRAAIMPALSRLEISRLLVARDQVMQMPINLHPTGVVAAPARNTDAIGSLLAQAHIDAGRRNRLALTTRSACHSLWIIADDPQRQWYSLVVRDETHADRPVTESVVW